MSCPDCELHLQRLLDGDDAPAPPAVTAHLNTCPACRDRQAAARLLLHGLGKFPIPASPAPDLSQRIRAAVLADRQERLTWRRRQALLAAAAALLLAPFLSTYWLGRTGPTPTPAPVAKVKPMPVVPPIVGVKPEPKTPPLGPQLEESQVALQGLVDRIHQSTLQPQEVLETVSLPLEMASLGTLTNMEPLNQPLESATAGVRHANQGFVFGTQVVTGTTRRALTYFSRGLPPQSALRKPPL